MSLYSPWVLLSGPLRCHICGIRRSFVSHREQCIFYKLLFSVPGGVHAILKHSVVMAPWNGSPALRLMTVPHFSHVFLVCKQAMPVCQALYACGALLGVKQTRALTLLPKSVKI